MVLSQQNDAIMRVDDENGTKRGTMTAVSAFTGKVAIVTGAASGIGRAAACAFAAEGARVVAADLAATVDETARLIADAGGEAIAVKGDAGSEAEMADLVDQTARRFGGPDIFFANAGITGGPTGYFNSTADLWLDVLRVNLVGPFLAVKYASPHMKARGGGAIICTASVAGLRAGAGPAAYSASKAGVVNLVKTAALELSGTGVRVNAICPGLVETAMTRPALDYVRSIGHGEHIGRTNPSRRSAQPEEIAAVALFLASPAAAFINGQAIAVDGGLSALHPMSPRPPAPKAAVPGNAS